MYHPKVVCLKCPIGRGQGRGGFTEVQYKSLWTGRVQRDTEDGSLWREGERVYGSWARAAC